MLSATTRIHASDINDLEQTYPYIYWLRDYNVLVVSKKLPVGKTYGSSTSTTTTNKIMPYPYQTWIESTTKDVLYAMTINNYSRGDAFCLIYNPITGWECEYPAFITNNAVSTTPSSYAVAVYIAETKNRYTFSNGVSIPSGFYNAGSTLPSDIPSLDTVSDAINNALNATTQVTTQAVTINNNINNTYNTYQSGGITQAEFNQAMDEYRTQLETLANNSGATLADQMAVNNALTNLDITINQQVNNISPDLITLVDNWRTNLNKFFTEFNSGTTTQEDTLKKLNTLNYQVNQALVAGNFTSTADIEALNAMQQAVNNTITSVTNYSDLNKDVAESANASMESEMEFVDSLLAETTQSLEQLTPQLESEESTKVLAWIGMIWENEFFKLVLPWCAIAMLVCLVLGVRYRT